MSVSCGLRTIDRTWFWASTGSFATRIFPSKLTVARNSATFFDKSTIADLSVTSGHTSWLEKTRVKRLATSSEPVQRIEVSLKTKSIPSYTVIISYIYILCMMVFAEVG
jgi:hypothetical protein